YDVVRDMEMRNLVVPLVGDFAGPKALRSVARYLDLHHSTVSVFYTSNVEQYLFRGVLWQRFYDNVAALPLDARCTFSGAFFTNQGRVFRFEPGQQAPGPRSEQLLNPIHTLLARTAKGVSAATTTSSSCRGSAGAQHRHRACDGSPHHRTLHEQAGAARRAGERAQPRAGTRGRQPAPGQPADEPPDGAPVKPARGPREPQSVPPAPARGDRAR